MKQFLYLFGIAAVVAPPTQPLGCTTLSVMVDEKGHATGTLTTNFQRRPKFQNKNVVPLRE